MKANVFDQVFDDNKDVSNALDLTQAKRGDGAHQRIGVDLPLWMLEALDAEAGRLGVTRQSIIKVWLAERLEKR